MSLDIHLIPMLGDNYTYALRDRATGQCAIVDPAEAAPTLAFLQQEGWPLHYIINTHHHGDHIGGNEGIKATTGARIVGPAYDKHRIPGLDLLMGDGDRFQLGETEFQVIHVPGHTTGHVAYYAPDAKALFAGDTLFAMGCGRLFEGTPAMMWNSLRKLRDLPPDTRLYCGHEYTLKNANFAFSVDPDNEALKKRRAVVEDMRQKNLPTLPALMADECATNPFLRADHPALARALDMDVGDPVNLFAALRERRNQF